MAAGAGDRAGAVVAAALAAAFPVAAGGRAAAERRGAGDGIHQRTTRGRFGCDPRGGAAHAWTDHLRAGAFLICLCAHSDPLGERALALITPWPLIDFTQWSVQRFF